jgi:hypothetical protein
VKPRYESAVMLPRVLSDEDYGRDEIDKGLRIGGGSVEFHIESRISH